MYSWLPDPDHGDRHRQRLPAVVAVAIVPVTSEVTLVTGPVVER